MHEWIVGVERAGRHGSGERYLRVIAPTVRLAEQVAGLLLGAARWAELGWYRTGTVLPYKAGGGPYRTLIGGWTNYGDGQDDPSLKGLI